MNPQEVCALHRRNRYDLILLDLQMPGMDGFQVMEGLKTNERDGYLPVLVITAQPGHKLRALQAGAKDFISKPFDLVEVQDAHPQHARGAAAVPQARELQPAAGADGAGAHRRTARKRGALPQPDRAGLRLVLGAGREREVHQGVRPGAGDARHPRRRRWRTARDGARAAAGTRRNGEQLQATIAARQPFLDFVLQPRQRRRLAAAVPRQRRADVQPVLPLHRLPRHRRGNHRQGRARSAVRADARSPHSPSQNHLLAALPAAEFERLAATWSWCRCASARSSTSPAASCSTPISRPPPSCRCTTSLESGASAETAGVGNEGVVGISLFMGGDTTPSSAVVQTAGHAYRLERRAAEAGVRPRRLAAAPAAALHPGADDPDDARPRPATGTIRSSSSCAAGCC